MRGDTSFPIEVPVTFKVGPRPFIDPGTVLRPNVYRRALNNGLFDEPDSELALVHLMGLLSPFLNLRLLRTHPHGGNRPDAEYLDLDTGRVVRVEWELAAGNFVSHRHDPALTDVIACWHNNLHPRQSRRLRRANPNIKVLDVQRFLHHYDFLRSGP